MTKSAPSTDAAPIAGVCRGEPGAESVSRADRGTRGRPPRSLIAATRSAAAALALLTMTACASDREGALLPVSAPPPGASQVDMLVATTRQRSDQPGVLFNGERADTVSYQDIVVAVPPPSGAADPRDLAVVSETAIGPAEVSRDLARLTPKSGRVVVFVHGYNTRFEAAVFQFAQLAHDMNAEVAPILFSWPSRGRLLHYVYDRESANFSRTDLADFLRVIAKNPRVTDIVVLAHSMGAWLATKSCGSLRSRTAACPGRSPT